MLPYFTGAGGDVTGAGGPTGGEVGAIVGVVGEVGVAGLTSAMATCAGLSVVVVAGGGGGVFLTFVAARL